MNSTLDSTSDTKPVNEIAEADHKTKTCPICGGGQLAELLCAPDRFHWRKDLYRLTRCESCTGVWLANPPKPEEMEQHYTQDYHRAIVIAGEGSAARRWKDQVKLISRYKPAGGAILDMGCSSGGFLGTMRDPAWQLYGIEIEESTAERARATTGANVFVGDVIDAPFLPASFDVITCFDVLEHVYSPRLFLTRVMRLLKPGGIFYAMMPNIGSWEATLLGTHWFGLELPRHLSHFSPRSLRHLMTATGFEEVSVKTPAVSYLERSAGYLKSTVIEKLGFSPTPQSNPKPLSLPSRIIRKALRLVVINPIAQLASLACAGPCLEVVFRKSLDDSQR